MPCTTLPVPIAEWSRQDPPETTAISEAARTSPRAAWTDGLHLLRDVPPKENHPFFGAALAPQLHHAWPNLMQPPVPALGMRGG